MGKKKKTLYTKKGKVNIDVTKEIADIFRHVIRGGIRQKKGKILFDGKQYDIKIPKEIVELADINLDEDYIIFEVQNYALQDKQKPSLTIRLIRGKE